MLVIGIWICALLVAVFVAVTIISIVLTPLILFATIAFVVWFLLEIAKDGA